MDSSLTDLLILEDDGLWHSIIDLLLPSQLSYSFVSDGKAFEQFLASGSRARLYTLDDYVPGVSSSAVKPRFVEHYALLQGFDAEADVWYHGSSPSDATLRFCSWHEIPVVERMALGSAAMDYFF